jgi:ABC-type Fe3+ transport system substrate-binding protein
MKISVSSPARALAGLVLLAGLAGPTVLSGCGGNGSKSGATSHTSGAVDLSAGPSELVVISPNPAQTQDEFEALFKAKYPDASIKWVDMGGSSDDLGYVLSQFKIKKSGIGVDVFFGGGPDAFLEMEHAGALAPLAATYGVPAQLNGVPLRTKNWVGSVLSGFGILYNKTIATRDKLPVPTSWAGLGDPRLRNRILLADPRHSGSAAMTYELILQAEGWSKGWQTLTAMAGNARGFTDSGSQVPNDVASGEAVMGPAIDYYAADKIAAAGNDKLGYIEPALESVVTPDPIGMLRGAPHADLARKFIATVLSPAGQKLWMLKQGAPGGPVNAELHRKPILPSLYQPISPDSVIRTNPFAAKNGFVFDPAKSSHRLRALEALIGCVLIEDLDSLKARWAKTPDAAKLTYVPVTETQLSAVADKWDDLAFRNATISKWNNAMKAHNSGD